MSTRPVTQSQPAPLAQPQLPSLEDHLKAILAALDENNTARADQLMDQLLPAFPEAAEATLACARAISSDSQLDKEGLSRLSLEQKKQIVVQMLDGSQQETSSELVALPPRPGISELPLELLAKIISLVLDSGRAADAAALRRVCKTWYTTTNTCLTDIWNRILNSSCSSLGRQAERVVQECPQESAPSVFTPFARLTQRLAIAAPAPKSVLPSEYEEMAQQLEDRALVRMWDCVLNNPAMAGVDGPSGTSATEIRLWLSDPANAARLDQITALNLSDLDLRVLPKEIGYFTELQALGLEDNQLQSLPQEISNLIALQRLYLDDNQLQSLPQEIGNLIALQQLGLGGNQLQSLPQEIGNLIALQQLGLGGNQLQSLPKEIGNLIALQLFFLEDNQLQSLPQEIGKLIALQDLLLNDNQLQGLPKEIGNLTGLQTLGLGGNQLQSIPPEIDTLRSRGCEILA